MLCGAPATIAAAVLLWWPALFSVYGFREYPLESLKMFALVIAAIYALANYWLLASYTIKGRPFGLRWNFGVAAVCAIVAAAIVIDAMPPLAATVVILPIGAATVYFVARQRVLQLLSM
jgi:hypothetical protein